MKKFENSDIFYNTIKAYPKVSFFMNNGRNYYNRKTYPDDSSGIPYGSVGLFEFPIPPSQFAISVGSPETEILTEDGYFLTTEDDKFIIAE